jgi:N utilization substance protein B
MQALYAFFQSDNTDIAKGERELFREIDKIYDLYILQLALLAELKHVAEVLIADAKNKKLPTKDDLNPSLKFVENKFLIQLNENIHLKREMNNRRIHWNNEFELTKKIYNGIRASEDYQQYMSDDDNSYKNDRDFIIKAFREYMADHELLNHFYEEKNLYWSDDVYIVNPNVIKTIELFTESSTPEQELIPLYKDKEDDEQFAKELFRQTILKDSDNKQLIADKTKNWEIERIAMMDILLMKMAITELVSFPSIPVKATLNEFIEISKTYSTPKSKIFINGILDKLIVDLKQQGKITKTGRGLME